MKKSGKNSARGFSRTSERGSSASSSERGSRRKERPAEEEPKARSRRSERAAEPERRSSSRSSRPAAQEAPREESPRRPSRRSSRSERESKVEQKASRSSSRNSAQSSERSSGRSSSRSSRSGKERIGATSAPEKTGRNRRGKGGKSDSDKLLLYGGISLGAVGLILAIAAFMLTGKDKPVQTGSTKTTASSGGKWVAPSNAAPYTTDTEAKAELKRAHDLYARGASTNSNLERNNCYKEAAYICERVLCTRGISSKTEEEAAKLKYATNKLQTM
ncbi:MAG: hypothetical protein JXR97_09025 [Planctomycetes bacterium]|nr:hypothetical protein [Planctomycetota bacterium]